MAERIGAPPSDREWIRTLEARLAQCYRLTGSDPDGASDSMLAQHAVEAVRELREEADGTAEQLESLLGEIDKHCAGSSPTSTPQKFSLDRELYAAADKVRKERGDA